jgi:Tfp pilus assembly protein FimT
VSGRPAREDGFSLAEAVLALAVAALVLAASAPALRGSLSRSRVHAAAHEMASEMARLRGAAIAQRRNLAVRLLWNGGRYRYAVFADGDGDGVLARDVAAGIDPQIEPARDLPSRYAGIDFGLLDTAIPEVPPDRGALAPGADPVRFGRSDTITFSPRGTTSSGTLYISDGRLAVAAVVLYGGTGRIRLWTFDRDLWRWTL